MKKKTWIPQSFDLTRLMFLDFSFYLSKEDSTFYKTKKMCFKKEHIMIALSGSNMMFLHLFTLNYEMKWKKMEFPFHNTFCKADDIFQNTAKLIRKDLFITSHKNQHTNVRCNQCTACSDYHFYFRIFIWCMITHSQTQKPSRQRL